MIDAAIVGLGRWGRTLVEAVQGKSDRLRFTHAVSRNPDRLRDDAARYRLELVGELDAVLIDPSIDAAGLAGAEVAVVPQTAARSARQLVDAARIRRGRQRNLGDGPLKPGLFPASRLWPQRLGRSARKDRAGGAAEWGRAAAMEFSAGG